jgi:aminoglycoside 6-adenylyltransferase
MPGAPPTDDVEQRLIQWASEQDAVRAVLLTSTRAIPHAELDVFSDYDAVLVVRDVHPFATDRHWIEDFGEVLVAYWDPLQPEPDYGLELIGNVVWYVDRPRIDFTVWPVQLLEHIVAAPALPDELDAGYRVLLDKDGLAARLRPPTYAAFIPAPPDGATYLTTINDFFEVAPAVAVGLLRDDLLYARWCLDCDMRHVYLVQMLQWRMECDQGWAMPARALGKGLRTLLPADIWGELHASYVGGSAEANWTALLRTMALFRRVAREVGDRLGYAYPAALDARVTAYVQRLWDAHAGENVADIVGPEMGVEAGGLGRTEHE